ncbi:matrixin family metalloprotease [Pseudarthrobacter sp. L19]|uniref:matrixin family metalloprotease n=1 Tax=Pseudarthrobacter sp. L19 TaxID=3423951 RepID=UPI003D7BD2FF
MLIAWETTAEEPRFTNKAVGTNVMGLGGSEAVSIGNSGFTYVSGQLELNGPAMQAMIGREGPAQARGVIEHELGHVVGLDHVQDPSQLMNPTDSIGVTTYQAGDLTGLSMLGQGPCRPEI